MALALYRRYRPDTFDGVIGQRQVTEPLCRALDNNRLTHAYLFSGPRGCGKTSSARILARCVNCVEGPTSHPCGKCDSCRELAANGPGSIDVMEIDAASHNGVEDARDLRDRVTYGPTRDRYKIIILDEAHMVTPQSFNALLKTVEEPPDNVMFIFATTEPDKVIGTIRSRTHHYPFRLVPPEIMGPYLEEVCSKESITPEQGVLRLVTRAGGGSVRDTLSVLDQLMVGADGGTITYDSAVRLLGFTPDSLIGEAIDAVIDSDGAKLYGIVNKVVVGGYEPKKFVDDLLSRVRDLMVLTLAGEQAESVISDDVRVEDDAELRRQASALGLPKLTWMAETINEALEQMAGAISPRMRLELLAAKLLVPADYEPAPGTGAPAAAPGVSAGAVPGNRGAGNAGPRVSAAPASPANSSNSAAPRQGHGDSAGARPNAGITSSDALTSALSQMNAESATLDSALSGAGRQGEGRPSASGAAPQQTSRPAAQSAPAADGNVDEMWDTAVASLPDDAKVFVDRSQVPTVHLHRDPRNPARARLNLTFVHPVAQQAFSLAISGDKPVTRLTAEAVQKVFGSGTAIAPTPQTADGKKSVPLSRMPEQEQQAARRAALMYGIQLRGGSALGSASDLQTPARAAEGQSSGSGEGNGAAQGSGAQGSGAQSGDSSDGSGSGDSDNSDRGHAGASATSADGMPHGTSASSAPSGPSAGPSAVHDAVDPWADQPSLAQVQPIESTPEHHQKHVAVPDDSDSVDPWATQAPSQTPARAAQTVTRAPQAATRAAQTATREPAPVSPAPVSPAHANPAPANPAQQSMPQTAGQSFEPVGFGTPAASQGAASQGAANPSASVTPAAFAAPARPAPQAPQTQPGPYPANPYQPGPYPDDAPEGDPGYPDDPGDEYSLDDANYDDTLTIDQIAKMLDAKEVRQVTKDGENGTV